MQTSTVPADVFTFIRSPVIKLSFWSPPTSTKTDPDGMVTLGASATSLVVFAIVVERATSTSSEEVVTLVIENPITVVVVLLATV